VISVIAPLRGKAVADPTLSTGGTTFARRLPHVSPRRLKQLRRLFALLQAISTALAARVALDLFQRPYRRHLDAADSAWLAQGKSSRIALDDGWLQTYEWGHGEKTVLLAHGWGSHAPRFAPLAQALVNNGWRVVSFDAPAHGKSSGKKSNLFAFKRAIQTVLEQYGPALALVGHSFGALAILMSLNSDQSPGTRAARKAVLISMPSGLPFLVDGYTSMLGLQPGTVAQLHGLFPRRFGQKAEDLLATQNAAAVQIPVLLIHDHNDDVVPVAHSITLQSALPNAELHTTVGLGHSGLLRDTATIDVVCAALRNI
jgi:pimeloyl-ACP methyl ester carboxylesterase